MARVFFLPSWAGGFVEVYLLRDRWCGFTSIGLTHQERAQHVLFGWVGGLAKSFGPIRLLHFGFGFVPRPFSLARLLFIDVFFLCTELVVCFLFPFWRQATPSSPLARRGPSLFPHPPIGIFPWKSGGGTCWGVLLHERSARLSIRGDWHGC